MAHDELSELYRWLAARGRAIREAQERQDTAASQPAETPPPVIPPTPAAETRAPEAQP